jgi:hypothetical protein
MSMSGPVSDFILTSSTSSCACWRYSAWRAATERQVKMRGDAAAAQPGREPGLEWAWKQMVESARSMALMPQQQEEEAAGGGAGARVCDAKQRFGGELMRRCMRWHRAGGGLRTGSSADGGRPLHADAARAGNGNKHKHANSTGERARDAPHTHTHTHTHTVK